MAPATAHDGTDTIDFHPHRVGEGSGLLSEAAIASLLNIDGLPLRARPVTAVIATLNYITGYAMHATYNALHPSAQEIQILFELWDKLKGRVENLKYHFYPPPPLTADWPVALDQWIEAEQKEMRPARGGTEKSQRDLTIRQLLAFFRIAFGAEPIPGASQNFIVAWFKEINKKIKTGQFPSKRAKCLFTETWYLPENSRPVITRNRISTELPSHGDRYQVFSNNRQITEWDEIVNRFLSRGGDPATVPPPPLGSKLRR